MDNIRVFTEDELWEIAFGELENVQVVHEKVERKGWHNHKHIEFHFDGVMYAFEYKDHVSDDITDKSITIDAAPLAEQPITVDWKQEAEFIRKKMFKRGSGHITIDEIAYIIDYQMEYMKLLGLIE